MTEMTGVLDRGICGTGSLRNALFGDGHRRTAARERSGKRAAERAVPRVFPDAEAERDAWFALGRGCCEL
jgi:hypothetical protein